ncbi:MAG: helix-turn-helix transcriptional regulator [Brevundimonas sp.]
MTPPAIPHTAPADPVDALSGRQRDCLALAARGLTSAAIAERLGISGRTVDEHLMRACRTLGVRTRVQAVARLAASSRRAPESRSFRP